MALHNFLALQKIVDIAVSLIKPIITAIMTLLTRMDVAKMH